MSLIAINERIGQFLTAWFTDNEGTRAAVGNAYNVYMTKNKKHPSEFTVLDTDFRKTWQEMTDRLQAAEREAETLRRNTDKQVAKLEKELAAAKLLIAQGNTDRRVAELESELNSYRDPWLEPVRQWLEKYPEGRRWHSVVILREAQLVDTRRFSVTKTDERRLGDIMRRIGGWKPSENIGGRYDRGRGYYIREQ